MPILFAAFAAAAVAARAPMIETVACSHFTELSNGVHAECGYLRVPEDRGIVSSRTIGVPFAIVHNARRTADDPVVLMTGGPGVRGIPRTLHAVDPSFGGRDVIFFEQRGTALTDPPLQCLGYTEEKQRAQRGEIGSASLAQGLIRVAARCVGAARRSGVQLSGYTTAEMVADLEDLRALRDYRQINLVGLSYSGRVISEYARDHPDRVRAVVANTPLPIEADYDETGETGMRRSLDLVIAGCERTPQCDEAHPQLQMKFRQIVARAERHPWHLRVPDPDRPGQSIAIVSTGWVVANALLDQLYDPSTFQSLPARIDAIWSGDRKALSAIIDISKSNYPWLMRISVWCNEEEPFEDKDKIAGDLKAYPEFAGVDQATVPLGLCEAAGFKARPPAGENRAVKSNVPFLIFSGAMDPATQPAWHRAMVRTLLNATLVLFPWRGHGAGFNRCGAAILEQFLKVPTAKLDTRCVDQMPEPDMNSRLD